MKKVLFSALLWAAAFSGQAGGFQVNTQGQKALGLGGAYTAVSRDASAVYYNPGAMAMHERGMVSVGTTLLMPRVTFVSTTTGDTDHTDAQVFFPSYLYASYPVTEKISVGLSVNSPYGLGTRWDDNWEGRTLSREARLNTFYAQPTVAYQLSENFGIGAGVVIATGDILLRRQIGEINADAELSGSAVGAGFNVGLMGRITDDLSFGINFRSAVNFELDNGEAKFNNVPASLAANYPATAEFKSELRLPSTLSVGLTDRISNKLALSFEFNLSNWSTYDSLIIDFVEDASPDSRSPRKYENSMAFRAGAEYLLNDNVTLRGGFFYDESPVLDQYLTPDLPDGNRLGGTLGLSYKIGERFEVDAAYLFEHVAERNVKADPARGTSLISGSYQTYVNGFGVGVNYNF